MPTIRMAITSMRSQFRSSVMRGHKIVRPRYPASVVVQILRRVGRANPNGAHRERTRGGA